MTVKHRRSRISATAKRPGQGAVKVISFPHTPNEIRFDVASDITSPSKIAFTWVTRAGARRIRDTLTKFLDKEAP